MRLLPNSRRAPVVLAVGLAAALLALGWCEWYRPWEEHYLGRPTSWWDRYLAPPGPVPAWRQWLAPIYPLPLPHRWVGLIASEDGVGVMTELLGSRHPENRRFSADYLGDLGPRAGGAAPALLRLLADPDGDVRKTARQSLQQIDPDALAAYDREHPEE